MTTPSDILTRVRKLLRLSESPNEHEAASAAAAAQRLMDEHKLSSAMLAYDDATTTAPDEPIINFGADSPLDGARSRYMWQTILSTAICRANDVGIYRSGGQLHIYGRPSDAETARYLNSYLVREVWRLVRLNGAGMGELWRMSYGRGIVDTLGRKLSESREAVRAEARRQADAAVDSSYALVRVNTAIATLDRRTAEVATFGKHNLKLRAGGSYRSSAPQDSGARARGQRDGQSITISGGRGHLGGGRAALSGGGR